MRGIGTATPYQTVLVRSRIEGYLVKIGFKEGQAVKTGDLMPEEKAPPKRGHVETQLVRGRRESRRFRGHRP